MPISSTPLLLSGHSLFFSRMLPSPCPCPITSLHFASPTQNDEQKKGGRAPLPGGCHRPPQRKVAGHRGRRPLRPCRLRGSGSGSGGGRGRGRGRPLFRGSGSRPGFRPPHRLVLARGGLPQRPRQEPRPSRRPRPVGARCRRFLRRRGGRGVRSERPHLCAAAAGAGPAEAAEAPAQAPAPPPPGARGPSPSPCNDSPCNDSRGRPGGR